MELYGYDSFAPPPQKNPPKHENSSHFFFSLFVVILYNLLIFHINNCLNVWIKIFMFWLNRNIIRRLIHVPWLVTPSNLDNSSAISLILKWPISDQYWTRFVLCILMAVSSNLIGWGPLGKKVSLLRTINQQIRKLY